MLTREQVSNLLIVGDVPYGNAHRLVLAHDAEQRQRIAELEAEVKDALECVYIPGVWACNQCKFQLIASNLYVQDGTIGPDTDTVPLCPNDGTLMRRVTWKERVSGLDKYAGERLNEIDTLKAEVARLTAMQDVYKVAALENANTRVAELEAALERHQEEP